MLTPSFERAYRERLADLFNRARLRAELRHGAARSATPPVRRAPPSTTTRRRP